MDKYIDVLKQASLFLDLSGEEIKDLLRCVKAKRSGYYKDGLIIEEGAAVYDFGVLLSGRARAIKWDSDDRVFIVTFIETGGEMGVLLAASHNHISSVSVQALTDAEVLHIPFEGILSRCDACCKKHTILLRNYIDIVAGKGLMLHERISCLLRPTVRDKILTYLRQISGKQQRTAFTIPMSRNAMAEYLNTERSALSRELSGMKKDGLIDYDRNWFRLL
jgi:CRP-like cAMP-binding protein